MIKYFHPKRYWRLTKELLHDLVAYYLLPDSVYLRLRYRKLFNIPLSLRNPQKFTEKMQWLKLHDRNPVYHQLVDKYEVKPIVANIIGDEYIIKTLGVWDRYEDIDFDALPNQFVLKCTHDSGGLVIVRDKSDFELIRVIVKLGRFYFYES